MTDFIHSSKRLLAIGGLAQVFLAIPPASWQGERAKRRDRSRLLQRTERFTAKSRRKAANDLCQR
jgi:hypothetical protein